MSNICQMLDIFFIYRLVIARSGAAKQSPTISRFLRDCFYSSYSSPCVFFRTFPNRRCIVIIKVGLYNTILCKIMRLIFFRCVQVFNKYCRKYQQEYFLEKILYCIYHVSAIRNIPFSQKPNPCCFFLKVFSP